MKKWEYQTLTLEATGLLGGKIDVEGYKKSLNEMGREGWELIEQVASAQGYGYTRYIICTFKRELED